MCNVAHDNVHVLYMEYHRCLLCTCVTCVMQHYMECQRCLLHTRMSVMQTGCSSQGRQSADWTLDSPLTPKSNSLSCTCTQVSSVYVYLCNVACTVICYMYTEDICGILYSRVYRSRLHKGEDQLY